MTSERFVEYFYVQFSVVLNICSPYIYFSLGEILYCYFVIFGNKILIFSFQGNFFHWIRFRKIISMASFEASPPLVAQNPSSIRWNENGGMKNLSTRRENTTRKQKYFARHKTHSETAEKQREKKNTTTEKEE